MPVIIFKDSDVSKLGITGIAAVGMGVDVSEIGSVRQHPVGCAFDACKDLKWYELRENFEDGAIRAVAAYCPDCKILWMK